MLILKTCKSSTMFAMLYKMVISFGKVIGVMIIATALTVKKNNFSKRFYRNTFTKHDTHTNRS